MSDTSSCSFPSPMSSCSSKRIRGRLVVPGTLAGRLSPLNPGTGTLPRATSPASTVPPSPSSDHQFLIYSTQDGGLVKHHSLNRPSQFNTLDRRSTLQRGDMFTDGAEDVSPIVQGRDGVVVFAPGPPEIIPCASFSSAEASPCMPVQGRRMSLLPPAANVLGDGSSVASSATSSDNECVLGKHVVRL
ncbi:hypothetical protein BC829DRAFT_399454 [Chytridium lagenaria]|nr:hypothetical protein BC829DRAFT_399454 [Chytridium lagenaria]